MPIVIWREWYNEATVAKLAAMGTLPRNEIEIDDFDMDSGEVVARTLERWVRVSHSLGEQHWVAEPWKA